MWQLLAGMAIPALTNGITSYFNSQNEKEAAKEYAKASEKNLQAYKNAFDQAFGEGTFNALLEEKGESGLNNFEALLNDSDAWGKYLTGGDMAYQEPEKFSFSANDVYNDPSYNFRLQQGLDALDIANAARGLNMSSKAVEDTTNYAQNFASQEYSNAYNRAYNQYTGDRSFDYNKWLNEANQYYQNLTSQLNGNLNLANLGVAANNAKSNALQGMAGQEAANNNATAAATVMENNADKTAWNNLINNMSQVLGTGVSMYGIQGQKAKANTGNGATDTSYFGAGSGGAGSGGAGSGGAGSGGAGSGGAGTSEDVLKQLITMSVLNNMNGAWNR